MVDPMGEITAWERGKQLKHVDEWNRRYRPEHDVKRLRFPDIPSRSIFTVLQNHAATS